MKQLKMRCVIKYAWKTLTMPRGTTFELHGKSIGRFAFTVRTSKMLYKA